MTTEIAEIGVVEGVAADGVAASRDLLRQLRVRLCRGTQHQEGCLHAEIV
jgi:hypothetical protein